MEDAGAAKRAAIKKEELADQILLKMRKEKPPASISEGLRRIETETREIMLQRYLTEIAASSHPMPEINALKNVRMAK